MVWFDISMVSQMTSNSIVCLAKQQKNKVFASLAFSEGSPLVTSGFPHKEPVTSKANEEVAM